MSEAPGPTQPGPRQEPPPPRAQQRSCVDHIFRAAGVQQMGRPHRSLCFRLGHGRLCAWCHLLCGPVRWPANCSHGQGREASRSRLHRVGLFCFPKQPKCPTYSQGAEKYLPLPASGRNCKFILQRAGVEGQNWGHMCPKPQPSSLEAGWWKRLPLPSPLAGSVGKPPAPAPRHPRPHGHAQNPPSKLLTTSEKICPTSDVFHLILKSFAKELFFLEMPPCTG